MCASVKKSICVSEEILTTDNRLTFTLEGKRQIKYLKTCWLTNKIIKRGFWQYSNIYFTTLKKEFWL